MKQLIDKSTLVAEVKRLAEVGRTNASCFDKYRKEEAIWLQQADVCDRILSFINTLEVKEVDFDNDLVEEVYSHLDGIKDTADRMTSGNFMHHRAAIKFSANVIEKVLGLIGLKTQKGK